MSRHAILVYDDGCPMCRGQAKLVRRLDWRRSVAVVGFSSASKRWPQVAAGGLDEGVRLLTLEGDVRVGIYAVRAVALRLPLTVLIALALWVPPIRWVGAQVYRQVAARRRRDADACTTCAR